MLELIEKKISELFSEKEVVSETIIKAMKYSLTAGGKRIRPLILLNVIEGFGKDVKKGINTAVALECLHTYSLIHDDLPALDNDDYRRGKLTSHKVFGESSAILAGDGLLTYAFELISSDESLTFEQRTRVINELSKLSGYNGMVGGQQLDIQSENQKLTLDKLKVIHNNKTGKLLMFSTVAGGIISECTEKELESLRNYSKYIGLAFQIKDDLLDIYGNSQELGKPVGSDSKNSKNTYPSLIGIKKSEELLNEYYLKAINELKRIDADTLKLEKIAFLIVNRTK